MPMYGVSCHTCAVTIWEGDTAPDDGQVIATAHADAHCDRQDCPHTTTARHRARLSASAPRADVDALTARLAELETLIRRGRS